jgi:FkbM family methyltransferase
MFAATIVGKSGHVHAFEPVPTLYTQIEDSVRVNGFQDCVTVHPYALGEREKKESFFVSLNAGGSSLVNDDQTREIISVDVKNGDAILSSLENIDLIKIDVEGYEYEVLRGIHQTLSTHRPIIVMEFSANFYKMHTDGHGANILKLLRDLGYMLYDIEDRMSLINDDADFDTKISNIRIQTNIVCLPKK